MPKRRSEYPSDLTDEQWKLIRNYIPSAKEGGRPRSVSIREILSAIFYLSRSGCAWRMLPKDFPPWQTVYFYFCSWKESGVWVALMSRLNEKVRTSVRKRPYPSVGIIDSQSVRAGFGESRGFDGFKRIQGRKRHILVDSLGLIHSLKVHEAQLHDGKSGAQFLSERMPRFHKNQCQAIYADNGYQGYFEMIMQEQFKIQTHVKRRANWGSKGKSYEKHGLKKKDHLKPMRWVVERTFAWFANYRRLSKDYERKPQTSEAMIQAAMIQMLLRRMKPVGDVNW